MKNLRAKHKKALAELAFMIARPRKGNINVITLGKELVALGFDQITDGLWVLDISNNIEYYSPKFIKSLGFRDEKEFPYVPESWQKQIIKEDAELALRAFERHLSDPQNPYFLEVKYRKKRGGIIKILCAGTIINRDNPHNLIMVGTHEIIV